MGTPANWSTTLSTPSKPRSAGALEADVTRCQAGKNRPKVAASTGSTSARNAANDLLRNCRKT